VSDTVTGEGSALQLTEADLLEYIRFVSLYASGVDLEDQSAMAFYPDFIGPGIEQLHPGRTCRRQCGEFEYVSLCRFHGGAGRHCTEAGNKQNDGPQTR
jgi:hypothetical protein